MNKDALLATIIGLALGSIITGVLIVGPQFSKYLPKINFPQFSSSKPTSTPAPDNSPSPQQQSLVISSPLPDAIQSNSKLEISGISPSQSLVVIVGPVDDEVISVGPDGKYVGKITLVEGKNDIRVSAFKDKNPDENPISQSVSVYYTPETF